MKDNNHQLPSQAKQPQWKTDIEQRRLGGKLSDGSDEVAEEVLKRKPVERPCNISPTDPYYDLKKKLCMRLVTVLRGA
jgi:hypothetical protein